MADPAELWHSKDEKRWLREIDRYWTFVKNDRLDVEREIDRLVVDEIKELAPVDWYYFLHDKYFKWKFPPNWYKTTTDELKKYIENNLLEELHSTKTKLFSFDLNNTSLGLQIAKEIKGLGWIGASGLLAVLFPQYFATVDRFAVRTLSQIGSLDRFYHISGMNPKSLSLSNSLTLIRIMKARAEENNRLFKTEYWTPRRIDMVVWVCGREDNKVSHNHSCRGTRSCKKP